MRLGRSVTPSDEQIAAVNAVVNNGVSIITGGLYRENYYGFGFVRALKGLNLSITLCAPTGKAAKRMGEATAYKVQSFNCSSLFNERRSGTAKKLM